MNAPGSLRAGGVVVFVRIRTVANLCFNKRFAMVMDVEYGVDTRDIHHAVFCQPQIAQVDINYGRSAVGQIYRCSAWEL